MHFIAFTSNTPPYTRFTFAFTGLEERSSPLGTDCTKNHKAMNLNEILKSGVNLTVSIGIDDLREWQKEAIENTKRELQETILSDKAEIYLTPKQVSQMINVDLSSLWRWRQKGYLTPIEIGGKRRYRMSDIKALFKKEGK